jgi:predicted RNA polymerase sigma factor
LGRVVHTRFPDEGEVAGLLALMLLTDARREARTGPDGTRVPLSAQDRDRWNAAAIEEGTRLVTGAMRSAPLGPYQIQAAIGALHCEAPTTENTDWAQITVLYDILQTIDDNPVVLLGRAVAVAMSDSPAAGLALLDAVGEASPIRRTHRFSATRAHLLEFVGSPDAAAAAYRDAAMHTANLPEQRYLREKAAVLGID